MFSFLGAQISMSYIPGKPIIFDSFSVATLNRYSSYSWVEIVLNPTLTPSTHSKIHPIKYQASNIEHCMIHKNCHYLSSKLKLGKARNDPELGWIKKGLHRAHFIHVKFTVHDKDTKGFSDPFLDIRIVNWTPKGSVRSQNRAKWD